MRTKRRFAHEIYPHAEEGQTRPLSAEVPYLYAVAIGLRTAGTDWYDLFNGGDVEKRLVWDRTTLLVTSRHRALVADALLQGMAGQEAWEWADQRGWDESGEWVYERAEHYGVPCERIKPYPVLAEPEKHEHWSEPDGRGWRRFIETVKGRESECQACCEDEPSNG